MNKQAKYRMFRATINVAGAIIMSMSAAAAYAQNSVQQTPPELRDFRLDPEKPKPVPRPLPPEIDVPAPRSATGSVPTAATPPVQIRPPASPPPASPLRGVITVPDVRPATPRRTEPVRALPARAAPAPAPVKPVTSVPQYQAIPQAQPDPVIADPVPTVPAAPTVLSADGAVTVAAYSYWWITVGALAAAGLAAAYTVTAFFRRRRHTTRLGLSAHEDLKHTAPEPAASEAPGTPVPIATPAVPNHVLKRPNLDISFIPEKATISLAKLTIKGQIRIINQGNSGASAMRLRAVIISANVHQEQQIAAFHAHTDTPGDDIGTAAVGERIAMDIDLVIPLSELSSFAMGTKQLFAPIVAAHIDYTWDDNEAVDNMTGDNIAGNRDTARISCLIGREATPPKPKMGPLRLDLGPRSFAPLGQRPIFG